MCTGEKRRRFTDVSSPDFFLREEGRLYTGTAKSANDNENMLFAVNVDC